jgi:hypothetical protein
MNLFFFFQLDLFHSFWRSSLDLPMTERTEDSEFLTTRMHADSSTARAKSRIALRRKLLLRRTKILNLCVHQNWSVYIFSVPVNLSHRALNHLNAMKWLRQWHYKLTSPPLCKPRKCTITFCDRFNAPMIFVPLLFRSKNLLLWFQ